MDVKLSHPTIYISAAGLWPTVTLVVFGVLAPKSGQAAPSFESLSSLTSDTNNPAVLALPKAGAAFKYAALSFAVTTAPSETGSVVVSISRDEDPLEQDATRPVHKSFDLTRSATTSPTLIFRTFALVGK
jgi:hypothetical protein